MIVHPNRICLCESVCVSVCHDLLIRGMNEMHSNAVVYAHRGGTLRVKASQSRGTRWNSNRMLESEFGTWDVKLAQSTALQCYQNRKQTANECSVSDLPSTLRESSTAGCCLKPHLLDLRFGRPMSMCYTHRGI